MFPNQQHLTTPAWVAGAVQEILTDRIPGTLHGMANHIVCLDCKIALAVTDSTAVAVPGADLFDCLSQLTIRDILGNIVLRLRGRHLRVLMKAISGWRHADAAALPGTGSGALTRVLQFRIPFHGGPGGLNGLSQYMDAWLPVDRIRGIPIEVQWSAATPASFQDAVITGATLYVSVGQYPYRSPIVGADVRYEYSDYGAGPDLVFPINGKAVHTAIIANTTRTFAATYTDVNLDIYNALSRVTLWQLVERWNEANALDVAQHEAIAGPEFLPLIFQDRRGSVQGCPEFPSGRAQFQTTNTNPLTQEQVSCQLYNSRELALKLMGQPQTVFQGARNATSIYEKKNQPGRNKGRGVDDQVAAKLNSLLAYKLKG